MKFPKEEMEFLVDEIFIVFQSMNRGSVSYRGDIFSLFLEYVSP